MRHLFALLLILTAWNDSVSYGQTVRTPPVEFPFDISQASTSIDETIKILEKRSYHFNLIFHYDGQQDLPRVRKLVGYFAQYADGRYTEPGTPVPIHLMVAEIAAGASARPIYDETINTEGYSAHRANAYERMIAGIALSPGRYRLQATAIRGASDLAATKTGLEITYDPRFFPLK